MGQVCRAGSGVTVATMTGLTTERVRGHGPGSYSAEAELPYLPERACHEARVGVT